LATLGAVSDAGGAAALLAPQPPFDWTRLLLWLVLIGGALAVAGMAWSLLRQSRREDDTH
jgi:cytochrome c-type biogenesis protein CcmH/NrfF